MVKIRLKRFGRKNHAFWRINAIEGRRARDGLVLEELGFYDPTNKDTAKQVVVDRARVEFWVKNGAKPSETVAGLLRRAVDSPTLVAAKVAATPAGPASAASAGAGQ